MKFDRFAQWLANHSGRPLTFVIAFMLIIAWGVSGPFITFLMVFLIQNTQNRDSDELHIKLDELLRTTQRAHKALLDLEDMGPAELHALRKRYQQLGEHDEAGPGREDSH